MARATRTGSRVNGWPPAPRALAISLARPGDPYVMADGQVYQPAKMARDVTEGQPKLTPKTFKPTARRSLKELPADAAILNGVACVIMYTVLGIGDREIAAAMKVDTDSVKKIKAHHAYAECFDSVVSEFVSANSDLLHARLAAYSHDALTGVADIAFNGRKEENRLRAGMDILDRGGITKKDTRTINNVMNELRITIVKSDGKDVSVNVDGVG